MHGKTALYFFPQGFLTVYDGPKFTTKVAQLVAGAKYCFRLRASTGYGHSPYSACSAFHTQASVPLTPEPVQQVRAQHSAWPTNHLRCGLACDRT